MNEFELNNYFDKSLIDTDLIINDDIKQMDNNFLDLYGPYDGFIKGNLFKNLYLPYKDYEPAKLLPNNEYEEDLLNLNQVQFACHDINLFLDNYPDDIKMIDLYNKYRQNYMDLLQSFESKYGPINVYFDGISGNTWSWNNEPWPWKGDKY